MNNTALSGHAQKWLGLGFNNIIPVMPADAELHEHSRVDPSQRGKVPGEYYGGAWDGMGRWPQFTMTQHLAKFYDGLGCNVGLKCGTHQVGLDIDIKDPILAAVVRTALLACNAPIRTGQAPKFLLLFNVTGEPIKRRRIQLRKEGVEERQLIEVLGVVASGGPSQCVVAGTHPTGCQYEWDRDFDASTLPLVDAKYVDELIDYLIGLVGEHGWSAKKSNSPSDDGTGSLLGAETNDPLICRFEWDKLQPNGKLGAGTLLYEARQAANLPDELETRLRDATASLKTQKALEKMPPPPEGAVSVLADIDQTERVPFIFDGNGAIRPVLNNIVTFLMTHGEWEGLFGFDEMSQRPYVMRQFPGVSGPRVKFKPRPLRDGDYTITRMWLQRNMTHRVTKGDVEEAINLVCQSNLQNELTGYFEKVRHLHQHGALARRWLVDIAKVDVSRPLTGNPADLDVHRRYVSAVGAKWLVSAVRRALNPGCQADYSLVFHGSQGCLKSTMLRLLGSAANRDHFGDALPHIGSKDASAYLSDKWIVEIAELASIRRSETEEVRSFLTRRSENYRPSYGRNTITQPRRCVFAGTTNRDDFLRDVNGERRFWIVHVFDTINKQTLLDALDALWADALWLHDQGEATFLDPELDAYARRVQQSYVASDPWEEIVAAAYRHLNEVTIGEALTVVGLSADKRQPHHSARMKSVLISIGFTDFKKDWSRGPNRGLVVFRRGN